MPRTGVLPQDRRTSAGDVGRRALPEQVDHAPGVLVPEKQLHRWANDGGAVLPHD